MSKPLPRLWRVFYTRPRNEKKVADRLEARGVEVCLPMRSVLRQWSDRKKKVQEPLFPSYLFAHVDERQRLDVLADEGVVKTVSFGGRVAVVRQEEIDILRSLQAFPERIEAVTREAFPPGTGVMVTNGPLKGMRGSVSAVPKPLYLTVEIPSIHQAIRLQVPSDWVMRVDAEAGGVG